MTAVHQPFPYFIDGPLRNRNQTLLTALSGNPYETFIQKKVLHPERAEFRYTQSATVHGLYHGSVTLALREGKVYLAYYAVNLSHREDIGQMTSYLGGLQEFAGIILTITVKREEPEQRLHSRYDSGL